MIHAFLGSDLIGDKNVTKVIDSLFFNLLKLSCVAIIIHWNCINAPKNYQENTNGRFGWFGYTDYGKNQTDSNERINFAIFSK